VSATLRFVTTHPYAEGVEQLLTFGERVSCYHIVGLRSLSLTALYALMLAAIGDEQKWPSRNLGY
jgi:hypothetical protein